MGAYGSTAGLVADAGSLSVISLQVPFKKMVS
jgi:hypothetical protein